MGSWWGLVDILNEARDIDRQEQTEIPSACPYDGTPLVSGPGGKLSCPFNGDYTYPDDGIVA
jgi:hypothetical protein